MEMKIRHLLEKDPRRQAKLALSYLLDLSITELSIGADRDVDDEVYEEFERVMDLYDSGYPLQYALGRWNFYGYDFIVDENVLIPRPETELLVEKILEEDLEGKKILDIGTGSGAIAICLDLNSKARVWGLDISEEALKIAEKNQERLKSQVEFFASDIFSNVDKRYDIIVSNPPYISARDYQDLDQRLYYEPKLALYGGEKGYEVYEKIISEAPDYLLEGGRIYLELGYDQAQPVEKLMKDHNFTDIRSFLDYNGIERIITGKR